MMNENYSDRIKDAIFIISIKLSSSPDSSIQLYVLESDRGHEAEVAKAFVRDNNLSNNILNGLINTITDKLETYFQKKENALFILDFNTSHGTKSLFVNNEDNIEQLATEFVEKHDLPRTAIKKLENVIKEKKEHVLRQNQAANLTSYTNDRNDRNHDINTENSVKVMSIEKSKKGNNSISIDTAIGPKSEKPKSRVTSSSVFTPTFVSSSSNGQNTSQKLVDESKHDDGTNDAKKNESRFDRLYKQAQSLKENQEKLKKKIDIEQKMSIASTSFKNSIGHTRNSPSLRVRSHSVDSYTSRRKIVDND
jgi:hypothetical protein